MEKIGICRLKSSQNKAVNCNYIANLALNYRENCVNNTIFDTAQKNFLAQEISIKNLGSFNDLSCAVSKCTVNGIQKLYVVKQNLSNEDTTYSSGVKICYL